MWLIGFLHELMQEFLHEYPNNALLGNVVKVHNFE